MSTSGDTENSRPSQLGGAAASVSGDSLPRLYGEFASWFHLLTAPEDYSEDAAFYIDLLQDASTGTLRTLLEFGSGGGNVASHMKRRFDSHVGRSVTRNAQGEHVYQSRCRARRRATCALFGWGVNMMLC